SVQASVRRTIMPRTGRPSNRNLCSSDIRRSSSGRGRCAITLDPKDRVPGQQPYQGVVPLNASSGAAQPRMSDVLEHYMRQSEQLDTRIVLAADMKVAAGLLIQRLPAEGEANIAGGKGMDPAEQLEHFNRIATLAASLTGTELLELDVETVLRRLFWQEKLLRFDMQTPRFHCTCSRDRVAGMIRGLGREEADSILSEREHIDVSCDFCGKHYRFDAVDAAQIFMAAGDQPPGTATVQ
ncbi:MAG: Hsp33 family molecular chaperone HslO, partial [Comamonadaceae bacterium]